MADSPAPRALSAAEIRARRLQDSKTRARDFAESIGISEGELVSAHVGEGVTPIRALPDALIPMVGRMGEVMALTRNRSAVHERVGVYEPYTDGIHAAMVTGSEIDLRIFPAHWVHGFAVQEGEKRSLQIFDAHGDAVHKIHLRDSSDHAAFDALVTALRIDPVPMVVTPRAPVPSAKADVTRSDELRSEWARMTDTHQFLRMVQRLKMNRLGANRIVGAPWARALSVEAVHMALQGAAEQAIPVMIFVGNMGCIQIHGGRIEKLVPMGPWINVMDPRFNLHLRADHITEAWAVRKPTRTGDAISVEAFDADGALILQIFAWRKDVPAEPWNDLVNTLPGAPE
ncbi:hemin-degrading factor [Gemmobacter serpentinus]|uniref:hemin-degrading factor n=1 Tax=Gemmobacter serpentinus TaxID=2652247 RepID=UPI00124BE2FC|nr:ChuX/HutX family heme-like substrate-binding protein [Gemmobacter serpentinus]